MRELCKSVVATISAVSLTACAGPEPMYVKEGVTYLQYQRDTVSCLTQAAQAVPSNTQLSWKPYVGLYTADTNEPLKVANADLCLREKGYSKVTVPLCDQAVRTQGMYGPQTDTDPNKRMHVGPGSCYYIGPDMRKNLHNPE